MNAVERPPLTPGLIVYLVASCAVLLWYVVVSPILAWRSVGGGGS